MLDKSVREQILQLLATEQNFIYNVEGLAAIAKAWPLYNMESTDQRFKDAYGDFHQHMVNNNDWNVYEVFRDRLDFFNQDEATVYKFLEAFVSPEIRQDVDFIETHIRLINDVLKNVSKVLRLTNYFEGRPVYKVSSKQKGVNVPVEIKANSISFFKDTGGVRPKGECFLLRSSEWDDYNYKNSVQLVYIDKTDNVSEIGYLRIIKRNQGKRIWEEIPNNFMELSDDFCSLGKSEEYYDTIKRLFPQSYHAILLSLKDAGIFPSIAEKFERLEPFIKSIARENDDEQRLRTIRFQLADIDVSRAFKFRFSYAAPYVMDGHRTTFNFDFVYDAAADVHHRIFVVIGKNGTGKTRMLASLAKELSGSQPKNIVPSKPLFSKIFTLSYSIFDRFEIPQSDTAFNYQYCGLKKSATEHFTEEELRANFIEAAERIEERKMLHEWYDLLKSFIDSDSLTKIFGSGEFQVELDFSNLTKLFTMLSSGQHILLYVLTQMFAHIRNNCLILYDEPETHLHPNAISELMNQILALVKQFDSFCIIATHSPLIVQSVQSRNIIIVEREENEMMIRQLDRESFGENISIITDDIFGNRDVDKDYLFLLRELKNKGMEYEQIIKVLESENELPMSLNIRLKTKSLYN